MFDVGFAELFLLALIGLLVLGPERLPAVARTLGGYVRKARSSWISLRNTIESELAEADISAPIKRARKEMQRIGKDLQDIPGFTEENSAPGANPPNPSTPQQTTQPPETPRETDTRQDDNAG